MSQGLVQILLTGLIGLVAGLVGGWQAGSQRARAFAAEWARSRQDDAANRTVQLIQDIATKLARAAHSMWWLAWRAAHDKDSVDSKALADWQWELHQLIPEIVGAQAALRALSPSAADQVDPAVARLHIVCGLVSEASVPARAGDVAALAALLPDSIAFKAEIGEAMKGASGRVLSSYGENRP